MVEQVTLSGVVLQSMPISEYDRRLVILTKERGKITAFARGARKSGSSYLAGSQPMTFGEFTVYQGRNSYTITGIKVTKYFSGELTDLETMTYGMYFLEIADYYGREGIESKDMLNLLYLSMKALTNDAIPNTLIKVIYEMKAMVINGEYPNMFTCAYCKREDALVYFDMRRHGMICNNCMGHADGKIQINESALYAIQYIITSKLSQLFTFNVTPEVLQQMEEVVTKYLNQHVDKQFKSLEFLN